MFAALREVLHRRGDVHAVVLPDLTHIAHIASVAGLTHAGLARYLGVAVLVVTRTPGPTPPTATIRRCGERPTAGRRRRPDPTPAGHAEGRPDLGPRPAHPPRPRPTPAPRRHRR